MDTSRIKNLIDNITDLLPKNAEDIKEDFKDNLKIVLNDYLRKIEVVTRESLILRVQFYQKQEKSSINLRRS